MHRRILAIVIVHFFCPKAQTIRVTRSVNDMMCTDFWRGMGIGMVLGAFVGMAVTPRRKSMKTCVGRTMQNMGNAMDCVIDDLKHAMK